MQFSVYQQSHIGGRKLNQDRMGYLYTREALLLVLADGMGGHLRGEVAATIALQSIATRFKAQATPYVRKPERFLEEALQQAHADILRYTREHAMPDSPRTTIVACLVQHNSAVWAHCGDSRLYWLRRGQVLGRTRDHSHIEYLIAKGQADASERATHPDRNKLYNCLGASAAPKVELSARASLRPGDVMLLCSDGLWAALPEPELLAPLATHAVGRAVPDLLQAALRRAGSMSDNVTALAITWQGVPDVPAPSGSTMISTETLPGDLHSTTIAPADPFDEAEIDKAIAEIRGAIERSSQLLK